MTRQRQFEPRHRRHRRQSIYLQIDDSGGTPRDLSRFVIEVRGIGLHFDTRPATGIDDTAQQIEAGIQENSPVVITLKYDRTATTGTHAVLSGIPGLIGTINYGPDGNQTGKPKISGEFLCTDYHLTNHPDRSITITARFTPDGPVTVATW